MRESFILYASWWEHIQLLSDQQRGHLLTAIYAHAMGQELPPMDGITAMAFSFIRAQLDRDAEAYAEKCKTNRLNGAKGGRPRKNQNADGSNENPEKPNGFFENPGKHEYEYDYDYDYDYDSSDDDDDEEDDIPARAREDMTPPEEETTWADIDATVQAAYHAAYGRQPTPEETEWLSRIAVNFGMEDLIGEAIRRAAQYGATSVGKYVAAIAQEWASHGITTLGDLEAYDILRAVVKGELVRPDMGPDDALRCIADNRDAKRQRQLQRQIRGQPLDRIGGDA